VFAGVLLASALLSLVACGARAQTPEAPPRPGYRLESEHALGTVTVRRWVNVDQPDVSPSGMCECITTISAAGRVVLTIGEEGSISAVAVDDRSGRDLTGDGPPDIVVSEWSGGAHCCYSTAIYSLERGAPLRELLHVNTGSCTVMLDDIDGDGRVEAMTCEDGWETDNCSFAEAPFAPVVFALDPSSHIFAPATPRYAAHYRQEIADSTAAAQTAMRDVNGHDAGTDKCTVLAPVLGLLYTGRIEEGITLLRRLYRHDDAEQFESALLARVRSSPLWVAR
jgi:hypothetical protein